METTQLEECLTSFKDVGTLCLKEWLQNYLFPFVHKENFLEQAEKILKDTTNSELHFIISAKIKFLTYRYINLDVRRQQGSSNGHEEIEKLVKSIIEKLNVIFSDELYRLMYLLLIIEIQQEEEFSDTSKNYRDELLNSVAECINEDNADIFISLIDHYLQTEPNKQFALCLVEAALKVFKGNEELLIEFSLKKADLIASFRIVLNSESDDWTEWWDNIGYSEKEKRYDQYLTENIDLNIEDYILYARLKTSRLKYWLAKEKYKFTNELIEICIKLDSKLKIILFDYQSNKIYHKYINSLVAAAFNRFQSVNFKDQKCYEHLNKSLNENFNSDDNTFRSILHSNKSSLLSSEIFQKKKYKTKEKLKKNINQLNKEYELILANYFKFNLLNKITSEMNSYRMIRTRFFHKENELYLYIVNNLSYLAINFNKQRNNKYSVILANNLIILQEIEENNVREELFNSIENIEEEIDKMPNKHIISNLYFLFLLGLRRINDAQVFFNRIESFTKNYIINMNGLSQDNLGKNIQETIKNILSSEGIINKITEKGSLEYSKLELNLDEKIDIFIKSKKDIGIRFLARNFRSDITFRYLKLYNEYEQDKKNDAKDKLIDLLRNEIKISKLYLYIFNNIIKSDSFSSTNISFLISLIRSLYNLSNNADELLNNLEYIYLIIQSNQLDKSKTSPYTKLRAMVRSYCIYKDFIRLKGAFPNLNYNEKEELDNIIEILKEFPDESYARFKWKSYYSIALEIYKSNDEDKLEKSKKTIEKAIKILDERFKFLSPEEKVGFFKENNILSLDGYNKISYISAYKLYLMILYKLLEKSNNKNEKSKINITIFNILEKINTNAFRHLKTGIRLDSELSKLYKDVRILKLFNKSSKNYNEVLFNDLGKLENKLRKEENKLGIIHKKIINTEMIEFYTLKQFFKEQLEINPNIPSFQIIYSSKLSINKGLENNEDSLLIWSVIFSMKNKKLITEYRTTLIEGDGYNNLKTIIGEFKTTKNKVFNIFNSSEQNGGLTISEINQINKFGSHLKTTLGMMYNQISSEFKLVKNIDKPSFLIVGSVDISEKEDIFIPWEVLIDNNEYLFEKYIFDHFVTIEQYINSINESANNQKNNDKICFLIDVSLILDTKGIIVAEPFTKNDKIKIYQVDNVTPEQIYETLVENNYLSIHLDGIDETGKLHDLNNIFIQFNKNSQISMSDIISHINEKGGNKKKIFSFINACSSKNISYLMLLGNITSMIGTWERIYDDVAKEIATYFYKNIGNLTVSELLREAKLKFLNTIEINLGDNLSINTDNPAFFFHLSLCGIKKSKDVLPTSLLKDIQNIISKLEGLGEYND